MALLLDHFKLTLDDYARLTDRQIFDLYLHARRSDGSIDHTLPLVSGDEPLPAAAHGEPAAATGESVYRAAARQLDDLAATLRLPPDKLRELHQQLKGKHGQR